MTAIDKSHIPHCDLVLASASPRRLDLLRQIGVEPAEVVAADIDETPRRGELARDLALRLAAEKVRAVAGRYSGRFILGADTVVACGRRILPKAETAAQARDCLMFLSGRRHHVYSGICVLTDQGKEITRLCDTVVKFRRLCAQDVDFYVESGEWRGKAGGYGIQGFAESYISFMQGSYSNVVGLSLYDTMQILRGNGFFLKQPHT